MNILDWSHQQRGIDLVRQSIASGHRAPICCMATGGGKSRLAGEIIQLSLAKGKRSLFIVHRRNLVRQFVDTLIRHFGIKAGFIMSGEVYRADMEVYVGTVQTIGRRLELGQIMCDELNLDMIIVDECHTGISPQYIKIYDRFPEAIKIGLTATPCRSDGRGLGEIFDDIVDVADTAYLTGKGILAPVRYFVPDADGIDQIKTIRAGKYDIKEQEAVFNKPKVVGDTVAEWLRNAENRPTILFAVNVAHSMHLQRSFEKHDVTALHLDARSSDDERDEVLKKIESGEAKIVCNVGLYVEGLDVPMVGCVQIARKVASLGAYRQIVGRGLRVTEEFPDCIVIDQGGCVERHGPVTDEIEWSLDGKDKAWKKKKPKEKEKGMVKCRACNELFQGGSKCPRCNTELVKFGRPVEVADGELSEYKPAKVNKNTDWATKRLTMGAINYYSRKKGYKAGWAKHMYRSIFGVWPNDSRVKDVPPIRAAPGSKAANMLKYGLIKKAKEYKKKLGGEED